MLTRRDAIRTMGAVGVASLLPAAHASPLIQPAAPAPSPNSDPLHINLSLKVGMVAGDASISDKFRLIRDLGYDAIELNSPSNLARPEVLKARDETGLRIHGVVDSVHWNQRLSSPDPDTRANGLRALLGAIRDSHAFGGSSVLLVPGRVAGENETQDHVWHRSIEEINKALPLAADLGVHILIENVWNGFCYTHDGAPDQTADQLAAYIDAIDSPWVGSYFDIGNHRKYGDPAQWIRTLGSRIVKLDVKDWSFTKGWTKIGEGDVNWPDVRQALRDINFTGWATAEVGGGDKSRLQEVLNNMRKVFDL